MKLIIEVTEGYYEYLKERSDNNLASVSDITILDGTPYEERPQGEWIFVDDVDDPLDQFHRYKCSECGRIIRVYNWPTFSDYPFCHCGADMRGGSQ